jgi:hypothetical protein
MSERNAGRPRTPSGAPLAVEERVVLDPVQDADAPATPVPQGGILDRICARRFASRCTKFASAEEGEPGRDASSAT